MGRLVVFSGAGLSAESGIQTFRDADGLWHQHRIEDVCNIVTWKENFDLVHAFYDARRESLATVVPNAAHHRIAAWQKRWSTVLVTQNIDDLLERAGCTDVMHLHGTLLQMQCTACGHCWNVGYTRWMTPEGPRRCVHCMSRKGVKPDVRFFGETCPQYRRLWNLIEGLKFDDFILVTGTSGRVLAFNSYLSGRPGMKAVCNLEPTDCDPPDSDVFQMCLYKPITQALDELEETIEKRMSI